MGKKNPFKQLLTPLKKYHPRSKMVRKINKQRYRVYTPPGRTEIFAPCNVAQREAERLRGMDYSVRVEKGKKGCKLLIRKRKD